MSSFKKPALFLPSQSAFLFLSFSSYLVEFARTFSALSNRSDGRGCPGLVLIQRKHKDGFAVPLFYSSDVGPVLPLGAHELLMSWYISSV